MVWCEEMQSSALLNIVTEEISRTVVKGTGAILRSYFMEQKKTKLFSLKQSVFRSLCFSH